MLDERDLDACVRCGLCLSSCPTYELTGMEGYSPRGRIASARALLEGGHVSPVVQEYLDTCVGCRACEAVCPSGVPYGRIIEGAREAAPPASRGPASRLGQRVLLWAVARRWRLSLLSLPVYVLQVLGLVGLVARLARTRLLPGSLETLAGVPRLKLRDLMLRMTTNYVPPEGVRERGQVVLFTGCVQDAWARDVHWATISVFTKAGFRVRVPFKQSCCGALHAHAGGTEAARRLAERNVESLERFAGPIIVNSAGCGAMLKEYGQLHEHPDVAALGERVRDWSEVLEPGHLKRHRPSPPEGLERIAVHDPCHLSFAQGIREAPRALLEAAGYETVDLPDGGRCCGAAGTYAATHREWAEPLRDAKLAACAVGEPDAVAVANPGCLFWMAAAPGAPPMYHPAQLIALALLGEASDQDTASDQSVEM